MIDLAAHPVVAITGATSGIGLATAQMALREGARVVVLSHDAQAVKATVSQLGDAAFGIAADTSNATSMQRAAQATLKKFHRIDAIVNNAGIWESGSFFDLEERQCRKLLDVNVHGVLNGCRAFVPPMVKRGSGSVVNIGSILALRGFSYSGVYGASKFAVRGFTQSLRAELHDSGISVSLVNPGPTATNLFRNDHKHLQRAQGLMLQRDGPQKVASAILRALEEGPAEINVGWRTKGLALLERISPAISERLALRVK